MSLEILVSFARLRFHLYQNSLCSSGSLIKHHLKDQKCQKPTAFVYYYAGIPCVVKSYLCQFVKPIHTVHLLALSDPKRSVHAAGKFIMVWLRCSFSFSSRCEFLMFRNKSSVMYCVAEEAKACTKHRRGGIFCLFQRLPSEQMGPWRMQFWPFIILVIKLVFASSPPPRNERTVFLSRHLFVTAQPSHVRAFGKKN